LSNSSQRALTGQSRKEGFGVSNRCAGGRLPKLERDNGQRDISSQGRIANFLEGFSAAKFPFRFPRLYGLTLEIRSFRYRIQRLWKRGDILQPQMGHVWETSALGHLIPNRRTQARIEDMQQVLSSHPWLSPEDWHVFLMGWDAGSEYGAHSDPADIPEHNAG
jgi:hypothetical protein